MYTCDHYSTSVLLSCNSVIVNLNDITGVFTYLYMYCVNVSFEANDVMPVLFNMQSSH